MLGSISGEEISNNLEIWIYNLLYILMVLCRAIYITVKNNTLLFNFQRMRAGLTDYNTNERIELVFAIYHVILTILLTVSLTNYSTDLLALKTVSIITLILGYGTIASVIIVIIALFFTIMIKACLSRDVDVARYVIYAANNTIDAMHIISTQSVEIEIITIDVLGSSNENQCCVCMCNYPSTKFKPCDHYTTCLECAKLLTNCPLCRVKITKLYTTGESTEIQSDESSSDGYSV